MTDDSNPCTCRLKYGFRNDPGCLYHGPLVADGDHRAGDIARVRVAATDQPDTAASNHKDRAVRACTCDWWAQTMCQACEFEESA